MQYIRWSGVDLQARVHRGVRTIPSIEVFEQWLLNRGIALMRARPVHRWYRSRVKLSDLASAHEQLATLLHAGVRLPQALTLLADTVTHDELGCVLHESSVQVSAGISFAQALEAYPSIILPVIVPLMRVGQESGALAQSLEVVAAYCQRMAQFKKQLRALMITPLITFIFFLIIASIILVLIVPQFATVFSSLNQKLPAATTRLVALSNFVCSWALLVSVACLTVVIMGMIRLMRRSNTRARLDALVLRIAVIGDIVKARNYAFFFQALAMLSRAGVPMVHAVNIASTTVTNAVLREEISGVARQVSCGRSLSEALESVVSPAIIALMRVGQSSGSLDQVVSHAAQWYQEQCMRTLNRIALLVNPLLMLLLGALVAALLGAVYLPIFDLSHAVALG